MSEAAPHGICQQCSAAFDKPRWMSRPRFLRQKFCSVRCGMIYRNAMVRLSDVTLCERFLLGVSVKNGCWELRRHLDENGYPHVKRDGKNISVGRLMYGFFHILPPPLMHILHHCDNTFCINPAHIYLGGHIENAADRVKRDRQAKGETIAASKLKSADVLAIRSSNHSATSLASQYGVTPGHIRKVRRGDFWGHI